MEVEGDYSLCGSQENIIHILFSCKMARELSKQAGLWKLVK